MKTTPERFWEKVQIDASDKCWEWKASTTPKGYGRFKVGKKCLQAHRVAYVLSGGTIPNGMQVDHLCRNRKCVNPSHLEPVTNRENILRGDTIPAKYAVQTHCKNGHELTKDNLYPCKTQRRCKECTRTRNRERIREKRQQAKLASTRII